jgi:hypothetical protein
LEIDDMILDHYWKLRQLYPEMAIVIFPEANMSWIGTDHIKRILTPNKHSLEEQDFVEKIRQKTGSRGLGQIYVWSGNSLHKDAIGVITGEEQKIRGADDLRETLLSGTLYAAHKFVSKDATRWLKEFVHQMQFFRMEIKTPADPVFSGFKVKYTGKAPGKKDDVVVAVQGTLIWARAAVLNNEFQAYARSNGWTVGN